MRLVIFLSTFLLFSLVLPAQVDILTSQYNNARTGANLAEKLLTPPNVNVRAFGKLQTLRVDGYVYAQPLFVPAVGRDYGDSLLKLHLSSSGLRVNDYFTRSTRSSSPRRTLISARAVHY